MCVLTGEDGPSSSGVTSAGARLTWGGGGTLHGGHHAATQAQPGSEGGSGLPGVGGCEPGLPSRPPAPPAMLTSLNMMAHLAFGDSENVHQEQAPTVAKSRDYSQEGRSP